MKCDVTKGKRKVLRRAETIECIVVRDDGQRMPADIDISAMQNKTCSVRLNRTEKKLNKSFTKSKFYQRQPLFVSTLFLN